LYDQKGVRMTDNMKATRILAALDNSSVPITWAAIDEPRLIETIATELRRMDRENKRTIQQIPVVDTLMMDDAKWQELAVERALRQAGRSRDEG